ncbi:hypothetical protein [Sphingobacterium cellulitidis]|uniref:hypothetical protein n=1 Tax=Sphingobacterium cellulitidis TaxID=1768011 RepID=UPI003C7EBEDD
MFFRVDKVKYASYVADHLQNPVNANNPMIIVYYRNYFGTALLTGYAKNSEAVYFDNITGKTISRRKWTDEMKNYAKECEKHVPAAPHRFKPTIFGYIFLLGMVALFAYLTYDSFLKPNPNINPENPPMAQKINAGDLYFGRFLERDPVSKVSKGAGFSWFKFIDAGEGSILISRAREKSSSVKPSIEMNSTDFEEETIPMKKIEHGDYQIDLVSEDGSLELSLTEKK